MSAIDSGITIALADTAQEREAIYRQRYAVYTEEMHLYQSVADHERRLLTDPYDATSRLLYARIGDEVVASLRIHLGKDHAIPGPFVKVYDLQRFNIHVLPEQIGIMTRFMVTQQYRGTQVTLRLMLAAHELFLQEASELAFIACAPHLVNLYLALGFRTYTKNYNDPEVGFVIPMVCSPRDIDHFERINSPLLPLARKHIRDAPPSITAILPTASAVWSEQSAGEDYWSQAYSLLTEKHRGKYSIFDGLSEDQSRLLLVKGHVIECANGELILRKGSVSHGIFVILSGVVEVRGTDGVLAVLGRDDVIGEMGFLLETERSADVYAASDQVRILSLDERALRRLIETDSVTAAKLLLNLSRILCLRLIETQRNGKGRT